MKIVSASDVKRLMVGNGTKVVNVLPSESFAARHIPGSHNIPLETPDFEGRVERVAGGRSGPVVVYCAGRTCDASRKAAQRLEDAGFTDVLEFEGGMQEWAGAGFEVAGTP